MSQTTFPATSTSPAGGCRPALAPGRRTPPRTASLLAAAGALAVLAGCAAPGMKLDVKSSQQATVTEMDGLRITLHRLDPQAIKLQAVPKFRAEELAELTATPAGPYVIGREDILLVTVWDHPEITLGLGQYRTDNASGNLVDEQGFMYFPYVGRIQVGGLTVTEARERLTAALARTLKNPQVDLKVLAYRSQKVYVGGEVKTPAAYNLTDVPFTLAEAVNQAGGFTPLADDSRVLLTRGNRSWTLNYQSLLSQGALAGRIRLQDGDSLQVPSNLEAQVFLMGEVVKPGTEPLVHGSLSLARAISDGGGISGATADARSIYVIRQGQTANAVDVYHLDARNPTAMVLADRFALNPRDFVYVDAGTSVRFNRVMNLILPTFTAAVETGVAAAEFRYFRKN